ncbi:hypothetical protein P4T04_04960 [Bacillus badius]|uniref:hypothetical protein n=1 Tax=Bacillus badius TaxID=1455 RepID=UPI002E2170B1|nr:hypothetical protein [Bacillus badius]
MNVQRLEKELDESLQVFNEEIVFLLDTHDDDYLTKDDLEDIGRHVFYAMHEFKSILIKHLKHADR